MSVFRQPARTQQTQPRAATLGNTFANAQTAAAQAFAATKPDQINKAQAATVPAFAAVKASQPTKTLSGVSAAFVTATARIATKSIPAVLAVFVAAIINTPKKLSAGAMVFSAVATNRAGRTLSATATAFSVQTTRLTTRALAGASATFSSAITRSGRSLFAGSSSAFAALVARIAAKASAAASVPPATASTHGVSRGQSATFGFVGLSARIDGKPLSSITAPMAAINPARTNTAPTAQTAPFTTSIPRIPGKVTVSILTARTAQVTKAVSRAQSAAIFLGGSVANSAHRILTAAMISFGSATARTAQTARTAALSVLAGIVAYENVLARAFAATLKATDAVLYRVTGHSQSATTTTLTASLASAFNKLLSAALSLVATTAKAVRNTQGAARASLAGTIAGPIILARAFAAVLKTPAALLLRITAHSQSAQTSKPLSGVIKNAIAAFGSVSAPAVASVRIMSLKRLLGTGAVWATQTIASRVLIFLAVLGEWSGLTQLQTRVRPFDAALPVFAASLPKQIGLGIAALFTFLGKFIRRFLSGKTPADRILVISADNRVDLIAYANRTVAPARDSRTALIARVTRAVAIQRDIRIALTN